MAKSTVETHRARLRRQPSSPWRAVLKNHLTELVALDFFPVPTIGFKVLFVLIVLAHERRKVVPFNVTEHPTTQWTAQQLIEAFPWETAPKCLLRDRDAIYGEWFQPRVGNLETDRVLRPLRSPWQNPCAEGVIDSIRREYLDHGIVLSDGHLRQSLAGYFRYYHRRRTHLSVAMDSPEGRPVQPSGQGAVAEFPEVGGFHHHYERVDA